MSRLRSLGLILLTIFLLADLGVLIVSLLDSEKPPPQHEPAWIPDPVEVEWGRGALRRSDPTYGCATCHGLNAGGSSLGPALRGMAPVYFRKYAHDAARVIERVIRHLKDPDLFPALASEEKFFAPMPPYEGLPDEELRALAVYVLSLAPAT